MGKSLQLAALLTLLSANLFGQSINSVVVLPQNPTSSDEVMLDISGDRWSSDMYISSITLSQNFNSWTIDIEFMNQGIGLPVVIPFDTIISLGMMPTGSYDCQVNGILSGNTQDFDGANWIVSNPTGIRNGSAAELKFICSPNPFSSEAIFNLSVPEEGKLQLKLYDILGQEVASVINEQFIPGVHKIKYLGAQLPAGRYYVHLTLNGETIIRQVVKK